MSARTEVRGSLRQLVLPRDQFDGDNVTDLRLCRRGRSGEILENGIFQQIGIGEKIRGNFVLGSTVVPNNENPLDEHFVQVRARSVNGLRGFIEQTCECELKRARILTKLVGSLEHARLFEKYLAARVGHQCSGSWKSVM